MPPRVLFRCRQNLFDHPGGDVIQVLETKRWLERRGVHVDISVDPRLRLKGYDLVHIFNPTRVSTTDIRTAKNAGLPVVVSPIYWDMTAYARSYTRLAGTLVRFRPTGWTKAAMETLLLYVGYATVWIPYIDLRMKQSVEMASLLLPNSHAEAILIAAKFGCSNWRVVPNGADPDSLSHGANRDLGISDFVLCVGRLEPRKNQHALIEALMDTDFPLVFVGRASHRAGYAELCWKMGQRRGNTHFVGQTTQEELWAYYRRARVHALPSWYETPGLANLEAMAAGCAVVATRRGGVDEYLGSEGFYCDPSDQTSVRDAVIAAYTQGRSHRVNSELMQKFSWSNAASATHEAYLSILG